MIDGAATPKADDPLKGLPPTSREGTGAVHMGGDWQDSRNYPPAKDANRMTSNVPKRLRSETRKWDDESNKKIFLRVYRHTGSVKLTVNRMKEYGIPMSRQKLLKWSGADEAFKGKAEAVKGMWAELNNIGMRDFSTLSLDVIELCLEQREDLKLAYDAAKWQLKSQGLAEEKADQEIHVTGTLRHQVVGAMAGLSAEDLRAMLEEARAALPEPTVVVEKVAE